MLASGAVRTRNLPQEIDLDIAASPASTSRARPVDRLRAGLNAGNLAAVVAFVIAAIVYIRTLLPGVSFGDWAESELLHSRLGILHPTGYPLYSLLGKAFSMIPVESVAFRANLLSATAAAGAVGIAVLIAVRLGVRPVIAAGTALGLAFTGTLWQEANFSEMNSLHLFLVALLLHRALVWHQEGRYRDLFIGALIAGLCVSNHGLAIAVVPIVILFILWDARPEIRARPLALVGAAGAFALGLLPYLYLPVRAMAGPADVYRGFLTWDGFFAHVSGAQFRGDMKFGTLASVQTAIDAMPKVVDHVVSVSNVVFVVIGVLGVALILRRDRWLGSMLVVLGVVNVYMYANYLGDLHHYLLLSWLILTLGFAVVAEALVQAAVRVMGRRAGLLQYAILVLPVVLLASNWTTHDESANHDGERFAARVFAALPQDAVLVTYWDALTTLSYKHCVEGVRPDVSLRAYDEFALVTCDPIPRPLTDVAKRRPVYALMMFPERPPEADRAGAGPDIDDDPPSIRQALHAIRPRPVRTGPDRRGPLKVDEAYALLDFGGAARLERFGGRVTDRPHPGALGARGDPAAWGTSDLRYDRDGGWVGAPAALEPWPIEIGGVRLELRPTDAGQVGVFPEHAAMLPWLRDSAAAGAVLHLFAYTGLVTLALASAGASVTHVDASRPTVAWARRNAELSKLADRPVRWIVDDAAAFVDREARRGRQYAGIVLDPPSYGHGPDARAWRIEDDLPRLLAACARILEPAGFVLLTAHTVGFGPDRLADALMRALGRSSPAVDAGDLGLATPDGRVLGLGAFARTRGGA